MELERPIDNDFEEHLVEWHEQILQGTLNPSLVKHHPDGETLDEDLKSCLECLTLIERVRRRQNIESMLLARVSSLRSTNSHILKKLGRFVIERELGRGGAGIVLLATDTRLGPIQAYSDIRDWVDWQEKTKSFEVFASI